MVSTTAASADLIVASEPAVATRASQGFEHRQEIIGRWGPELDGNAGDRVREPQQRGVQEQARGGDLRAIGPVELAVVDGLTDQRVSTLGEVNADLVRPAGLEAHPAERGPPQALDRLDVGDGLLPLVGVSGRAADPVAAI